MVFNVLLQVLDDGRITDSQGRTVDFKNTIIILTSNLGSQFILEDMLENGELSEQTRDSVTALLRRSFRPEFLNRLDDTVFYKPLSRTEIGRIVELMAADLRRRMEKKDLRLVLTEAALDHIADQGYDPVYGARPLKRYIQSHVETLAARHILKTNPLPGTTLTVDCMEGELVITE